MARQTLGRGLSALMGEEKVPAVEQGVREIDIDLIDPNPEQPRTRFAEEKLAELAASIRSNGIVQPIVLRPIGTRYQIVAGERRWRAAQRAELRKVPAVVRDIPDDKLLEIALIENIQRHELNPIEEAKAYRKLIEFIGLTQEQVAERVGRERTLVATTMRLLKLPSEVQNHIIEGRLSLSHGRALLMIDDPKVQRMVAKDAVERGFSVRETERTVKRAGKVGGGSADKPTSRVVDPNTKAAETKLMRRLSTNVKILPSAKGTSGKIQIEYYGTDDLDRIYQAIMGSKQ
ncbi:MAG TPA: ParB/RepB/Spo0J family partition protein [Pyrinomonadaceae bacterium]|nr:ParB/RepB/Spo0J family partition protein [Chloracidobacterium sp.]MBP9935011.1 ParB/RepB/Spo0J family partition protein [Pyrinomonadaceae bacterium]MBK9436682.1 ParB/RepB/Spo0J family partition protein [Chloracidobacterium sp.]MBK9766301.1 ParB/RepB/Spo0J family partition protein [Chloracidobacterium sp.]MBL0241672.1 ParB/RepB/Spo0J family partition protein [Chloracidobacterium sp.]